MNHSQSIVCQLLIIRIAGQIPPAWPSSPPSLTFRFLFAYHDPGFPGPTVGHHEFTRRTKQRGWTVVSEAVGSSQSCAYALLRLPGNAATLALLPSESSS